MTMTLIQIEKIRAARQEAKEHEARLLELLQTDINDSLFSSYQLQASMYAGQRIAYEHALNICNIFFD